MTVGSVFLIIGVAISELLIQPFQKGGPRQGL